MQYCSQFVGQKIVVMMLKLEVTCLPDLKPQNHSHAYVITSSSELVKTNVKKVINVKN